MSEDSFKTNEAEMSLLLSLVNACVPPPPAEVASDES